MEPVWHPCCVKSEGTFDCLSTQECGVETMGPGIVIVITDYGVLKPMCQQPFIPVSTPQNTQTVVQAPATRYQPTSL